MTPLQRAMFNVNPQWRSDRGWAILGRVLLFLLIQFFALFMIFWAGIFTLIGAIWHADPNYIWIFLLIVGGFEMLMLRILFRTRIVTILGVILLIGGLWLHHHDSVTYNESTCRFIKNSTCQPFGGGFICRQQSDHFINERTISRDDISACNALDEL
jgi:hypothetical protein